MSAAGMVHIKWKHVNNSLVAFNKRADLIGPHQKRRSDLAVIDASVVGAGDAALVAALVVQNLLDDVRLHAEIGQLGGKRSANVVQHERLDASAKLLVEISLGRAPTDESSFGTVAKS